MTSPAWRDYWADRSDGGHRSQAEEFLRKEAAEKLFHLGSGSSLLDLGCGSADLLVYYAAAFTRVAGVDFSPRMLAEATRRVADRKLSIELVEADDATVWDRVTGTFDRVTAGQVVQYLDPAQLERFLERARGRLATGGRVILFDVIDPRIYALSELGLFERQPPLARARRVFDVAVARLRRSPHEIGHRYAGYELARIAERAGFRSETVWSMYYEYRYHALLDPA
ncbi:MAG: methyltransferase domain-containing protein [Deltaproteobacteria bacterium]